MVSNVTNHMRGYLRILVSGDSLERFINICNSRQIYLWDLESTNEGCLCNITVHDFRQIKPIARKTSMSLSIRKRCGFPFFLHKYQKQKMFLIGIFLFFALIHICSLFIWDIHIEGNFSHSYDTLIDFLKEEQVYHGIQKSRVSCEEIEKNLRNAYPDITWVSASISGTRLMIQIKENFDAPPLNLSEGELCDIIAEQDGIIVDIITRSGTPLVKKGDVVAKGDILISSEIKITDDGGNVVRHEYLPADGDIIAEIVMDYEETISLEYIDKLYTGQEKQAFSVTIWGKRLFLSADKLPFSDFDMISEKSTLAIGTNFYLPISWEKWYYKEYETEKGMYSDDEAVWYLQRNMNQYFQNFLEKGVQIIRNNVKIQIDQTTKTAVASGKVVMQAAIGVKNSIETMAEENFR